MKEERYFYVPQAPLSGELPCTEWMPGRIVLQRDDEGLVRAYYNNVIIN